MVDVGSLPPGFAMVLETAIEPPPFVATFERVATSCGCTGVSLRAGSTACPPGTKLVPDTRDLCARLTYRRLPPEPAGNRQDTVKLFFLDIGTGARWEQEIVVRASIDPGLSLVAAIDPPKPVDLANASRAVVPLELHRAIPLAQVRVSSQSAIKCRVVASPATGVLETAHFSIECSEPTLGTHTVQAELPFRGDVCELVLVEVPATVDPRPEPSRIVRRVRSGHRLSGSILIRGRLFVTAGLHAVVEPAALTAGEGDPPVAESRRGERDSPCEAAANDC